MFASRTANWSLSVLAMSDHIMRFGIISCRIQYSRIPVCSEYSDLSLCVQQDFLSRGEYSSEKWQVRWKKLNILAADRQLEIRTPLLPGYCWWCDVYEWMLCLHRRTSPVCNKHTSRPPLWHLLHHFFSRRLHTSRYFSCRIFLADVLVRIYLHISSN